MKYELANNNLVENLMGKVRKRTKPYANLNGHQSYGQYKELSSLAMSLVFPYSYYKSQSQPLSLMSKEYPFYYGKQSLTQNLFIITTSFIPQNLLDMDI